jgi:multimeric flavodoxin WrbA
MLVVGLQGSPRRKGNTSFLLDRFMAQAARMGARTRVICPGREPIAACRGCGACEKQGLCVSQDIMAQEFFPLLREADVVVAASPVYFYGLTAQLKSFIDRCQTLWSRKYRLRLADPGAASRAGVLLAVAASRGPQLFDGLHLTARYFFDAIGARDAGSLTYRGIEHPGDMARHPTASQEVHELAEGLLSPLAGRPAVGFSDDTGTGAALVAAAWMRYLAGKEWDVYAGPAPVDDTLRARLERVMAQTGIDLGYYHPQPLDQAPPALERVIAFGQAPAGAPPPTRHWSLPPPGDGSDAGLEVFCRSIEADVIRFLQQSP